MHASRQSKDCNCVDSYSACSAINNTIVWGVRFIPISSNPISSNPISSNKSCRCLFHLEILKLPVLWVKLVSSMATSTAVAVFNLL